MGKMVWGAQAGSTSVRKRCWPLCAASSLRGLISRADIMSHYSGELFRYSTISMEWTMLDAAVDVTGTSLSARQEHAMSVVGTDIYVFGGYTESGMVCSWWIGRGQMEERAHAGWHRIRGGL